MHDINYLALEQLLKRDELSQDEAMNAESLLASWRLESTGGEAASEKAVFDQRLAGVDEEIRGIWLRSYANALLRRP